MNDTPDAPYVVTGALLIAVAVCIATGFNPVDWIATMFGGQR